MQLSRPRSFLGHCFTSNGNKAFSYVESLQVRFVSFIQGNCSVEAGYEWLPTIAGSSSCC